MVSTLIFKPPHSNDQLFFLIPLWYKHHFLSQKLVSYWGFTVYLVGFKEFQISKVYRYQIYNKTQVLCFSNLQEFVSQAIECNQDYPITMLYCTVNCVSLYQFNYILNNELFKIKFNGFLSIFLMVEKCGPLIINDFQLASPWKNFTFGFLLNCFQDSFFIWKKCDGAFSWCLFWAFESLHWAL